MRTMRVGFGLMIVALAAGCSTNNDSSDAALDGAVDTAPDKPVPDKPVPDGALPDTFPAPVADDCLTDVSAGQHSFTCEGIKIEVSVPDACIKSACGVVIDIHGAHMTAADEEANMNMRALGKKHGYIVVQPTAPYLELGKPYWHERDVEPLYRVLHRVEEAWHADLKRIHLTGFSQGGFMTWLFVCSYADELASVAPAAGWAPCMPSPSAQTNVLFLVGRKDAIVPPEQLGAIRLGLAGTWKLGPASRIAGDEQYERHRYTNDEGTVVEIIDHDYTTDPTSGLANNKGHCYPGSMANTGSFWDALKCKPPNAFTWGEEVIEFFVAHPKPSEPEVRLDAGVEPDAEPDAGMPTPATWVDIPAGTFTMGSPVDEPCRDHPELEGEGQHQVTLTHKFEIQSTEVTQGQFISLMGYNPSWFSLCGSSCPVETVNWHEAAAYCNALSVKEGHAECYSCSGSDESVSCVETTTYAGPKIYACPGYRLPTEAEWEYAYRAETTAAYYSGANDPTACTECSIVDVNADKIAWYSANANAKHLGRYFVSGCGYLGTHPVAQKQGNAWGLHDMAGNVWEWCHDWYQSDLGSASVTDPWGAAAGTRRVWRGGAWHTDATWIRAATRVPAKSTHRLRNIGFRCARSN